MKNEKKLRFFEVKAKNGNIIVMNEKEIDEYKEFIEEVRTEFTDKEIEELEVSKMKLTPEIIKLLKS